MAAPHGAPRHRCTRTNCTANAPILDEQDRPWCPRDYALIYFGDEDSAFERFLCAAVGTLARRGDPLPLPLAA